jgi:S1-C subfamily serine protease
MHKARSSSLLFKHRQHIFGKMVLRVMASLIGGKIGAFAAAFALYLIPVAYAQDAVPTEILQRTFLIKVGNTTGTAFIVDRNGKVYVVTARHVVAGLPDTKATFQLWRSNKWQDVQTVRTMLPSSASVDIAIFETEEKIARPFQIAVSGTDEGPTMGQQVWFLGYPFGDTAMTSRSQDQILPFIKRGTISAINGSNPDAVVLYIDGFNNPGFSGGPVVYWEFSKHAYRILGVVQGYRSDTAKVLVNGQQIATNLLVNSGILTAYSIKHVLDVLEAPKR